MRLSHSPNSGQIDLPSSQDAMPVDDLTQQINQKNEQLFEMLTKQKELEKMLEDKDEEIIELIQEVNKFEESKNDMTF